MIVDHIDSVIINHPVFLMTLVGRGTFPLFCYAIAIAVLKIKNREAPHEEKKKSLLRYFGRLIVLGLLTQPVYYFAIGSETVNVIFTLALGVIAAALSFRVKAWQMYVLYTLSIISMLWIVPLEFGFAGVMVPSAIVLLWRGEKAAPIFLFLLLAVINLGDLLTTLQAGVSLAGGIVLGSLSLATMLLPWFVLDVARSMRQDGRLLSKYALYVFYPGHLALLKAVDVFYYHEPWIK